MPACCAHRFHVLCDWRSRHSALSTARRPDSNGGRVNVCGSNGCRRRYAPVYAPTAEYPDTDATNGPGDIDVGNREYFCRLYSVFYADQQLGTVARDNGNVCHPTVVVSAWGAG